MRSLTPILKNAGMDTSDVVSYRYVANLSVLSKLIERFVAGQIWHHLQRFDLLPPNPSRFFNRNSHITRDIRHFSCS
jgi:hypothetical protein